mgnify:CR=1 FL=1
MMSSVLMLSALLAIANLTSCKTQYILPTASVQHDSTYVYERDSVSTSYHLDRRSRLDRLDERSGLDTIYIERWHTRWRDKVVNRCDTVYIQPTIPPDKPIPRFYKDCTKGFWILLIVFLGSFAFRIMKAIYLRK